MNYCIDCIKIVSRRSKRCKKCANKDQTNVLKKIWEKRDNKKRNEIGQKISKALIGKKLSKEHIEKLRLSHIGIKQSAEWKRKRSIALIGNTNWVKSAKSWFKKGHQAFNKRNKFDKQLHQNGYVYIYLPDHPNANKNGCIFEHRYILEKKIGRYLEQNEVTHHINEIKTDNRPENLEVKSRSEHAKIHHK